MDEHQHDLEMQQMKHIGALAHMRTNIALELSELQEFKLCLINTTHHKFIDYIVDNIRSHIQRAESVIKRE